MIEVHSASTWHVRNLRESLSLVAAGAFFRPDAVLHIGAGFGRGQCLYKTVSSTKLCASASAEGGLYDLSQNVALALNGGPPNVEWLFSEGSGEC